MDALTAMKQALEALESNSPLWKVANVMDALRASIKEMENVEPAGYVIGSATAYLRTYLPLRTYLYAHPAPVPEGWQLVPKEPTDDMLAEGFRNWNRNVFGVYQSMLAVAPKPENVK